MGFEKNFFNQNNFLNLSYFLIKKGLSTVEILRGAYDKFPDFFRMDTFIDSTHMKL